MKSPDNICALAVDKGLKIKIKKKEDFILIEGSKESLLFLSELIASQANYEKDCGFQISPNGAGNLLFDDDSDIGIYIHKKD